MAGMIVIALNVAKPIHIGFPTGELVLTGL